MAAHDFTQITTEEMTDYSVAAFDEKGKYDVKVPCPQIGSQKHVGIFRKYDTQAFNSNLFQTIADGELAPLATWGHSTDTYAIEVRGLRDFISDRDVANEEEAISLSQDTALFLARNCIKQRNAHFVDITLNDNNQWATELTGVDAAVPAVINSSSEFQRFDQAAAEPLSVFDKVMETMLEAVGLKGDTLIIPRQIVTFLKRNDEINQYGINNPTGGIAGGDSYVVNIIAQYCDIDASRIHIIEAVVDTATITSTDSDEADHNNEDFGPKLSQGTEALAFMAPKNILIAHMGDLNAGRKSQSALVEFLWTGLYPGTGETGNYKVKTNYNQNREGLYMEARNAFAFKVAAPKLGVLLKGAIA
jgi:hypothetical protein